MQRDEMSVVKADQNARGSLRRQIRPYLPQSIAQGATERHSYGPPPLRTQQVLSNGLTLIFRQLLEPPAHRLGSGIRAIKNQRNFVRLRVFCHPAPYLA
jgi:hypothetical protein